MMVEIKLSQFPEFKSELQFVESLVSEQSVFCLPGLVGIYTLERIFNSKYSNSPNLFVISSSVLDTRTTCVSC